MVFPTNGGKHRAKIARLRLDCATPVGLRKASRTKGNPDCANKGQGVEEAVGGNERPQLSPFPERIAQLTIDKAG